MKKVARFQKVSKKEFSKSWLDSFGENEIADVFSKGYRLGERILRPAMVKVAN